MSILLKEYHKLQNIYLQKYDDKKIYILAFLSLGSAFMNAKKKKKDKTIVYYDCLILCRY